MRRRDFVKGIAGAAMGWPLVARAQQHVRQIGVISGAADEPVMRARLTAFLEELKKFGWSEDHNIKVHYRWGEGDVDIARKNAVELAAMAPDVVLAAGSVTVAPLMRATQTVPIVFVIVPDPLGSGFVRSLSRPGRNATGFMQFEYSLSGKWLELLKEIAPGVKRVGVLWDPAIPAGIGQFAVLQAMAPLLRIEVIPISLGTAEQIERGVAEFVSDAGDGMVVTSSALSFVHRKTIVSLAARRKIPAVYAARELATNGGLLSYGADFVDQYRRAAQYVDRILKGEKAGDLPVQAPTKYELVINLRTAMALNLDVPLLLQQRADEVIE